MSTIKSCVYALIGFSVGMAIVVTLFPNIHYCPVVLAPGYTEKVLGVFNPSDSTPHHLIDKDGAKLWWIRKGDYVPLLTMKEADEQK